VAGTVTAVNGSTITINAFKGDFMIVNGQQSASGTTQATTITVSTNGSTKFYKPDKTSAALSDVKVGSNIVAQGTLSSDGKSMQANRVMILPAPGTAGGGFFGHGFFGHGFFGDQGTGHATWFGGVNRFNAPLVGPPGFTLGSGPTT
jgi:hypothetical protein